LLHRAVGLLDGADAAQVVGAGKFKKTSTLNLLRKITQGFSIEE